MDITPDIFARLSAFELVHRVETRRAGPFRFQVGLDEDALHLPYQRVVDAYARFHTSPLAQVANRLEPEVIASSVFGTNTIEGGTLSEEQTRFVLDLAPEAVADEEQRRALNIKAVYQLASQASARANWRMDIELIRSVHATITDSLTHPFNQPGEFRDNPRGIVTHVGDATHGGRYKPPQHGADIESLLAELAAWHDRLVERGVPALVRAPLVHYYFELIHPFWDGNGRVGRVLEATLLLAAGFEYAPYTLSRFYLDQLDRYFTLFNTCRKAAGKGLASPNAPFVAFHLEGMLVGINRLHDRVNGLVGRLLFESEASQRYGSKELNARQFAILSQLLDRPESIALADLRKAPWYLALYTRLTDKTRQRDLKRLRELQLVEIDSDQRIRPRFTSGAAGSSPRRMR